MRIKAFFLAVLLIILASTNTVQAQTKTPKGITVIPSIVHLDLATDPPQYDLKYINNTNSDINLLLSAEDFTQLEDSYKMNFLEGKDAANYKYSLSSWITFENKNLQLGPNEEKTVKIFIDKNRITRGGHYASILARVVQPKSNKEININPVLSSLLFVRASTGKEIESGKISSLRPDRDGLNFPDSMIVRFQNNGNVYVVPYGVIQIFDPFGNLVAKGILNEGSLDTLPESIRRYDTKLNTESKFLFPGIYSARIDMHFGKNNQKVTSTVKFFSQGSFNFIRIGLVLILGILMLYYKKRAKIRGSTPKS